MLYLLSNYYYCNAISIFIDFVINELKQYTEVSSTDYQYDLNGNLTDDGNQLYEYDYENRLTKIRRKLDNALIAEYRYDPFGRRAKKFVHIPEERVVNYLYDGAQVIEERNEDFEPERRFVYGPGIDEPVSIHDVSSGETYFYQRDGLGSVTELVDEEGIVIERYRYSPYGKLKIYDGSWNQLTGSTVGNGYFFTGRRYDPESGLYYYRARMYSSEVGRFFQVDPIGYWGDYNLYRYCSNDPGNWIDPFGLEELDRNNHMGPIRDSQIVPPQKVIYRDTDMPVGKIISSAFVPEKGIAGGVASGSSFEGALRIIVARTPCGEIYWTVFQWLSTGMEDPVTGWEIYRWERLPYDVVKDLPIVAKAKKELSEK